MTVGRRVKIYGPAGRSPAMTSFRGEFWPGGQAGSSRLPGLQPLPRHPPPPQPDHTAGLWQLEFLSPLALGLPRRAGVAWKTSPPPPLQSREKPDAAPCLLPGWTTLCPCGSSPCGGNSGQLGRPDPPPPPLAPFHPGTHHLIAVATRFINASIWNKSNLGPAHVAPMRSSLESQAAVLS